MLHKEGDVKQTICAAVAVAIIAVLGAFGCTLSRSATPDGDASWQQEFGLLDRTLVPTGRNPYLILEPGFRLVLEGKDERLEITVLDETKEVDGITTRIVEEREWKNGSLVEVSRNFFAICEDSKDVFYFGEDVDMYQDGALVSHSGAWLAGKKRARAGLIMPGDPQVGAKYYQEIAPKVAMDRAEVVSLDDTLETPVGSFSRCLKTQEGTALNLLEKEFKTYAPGIGLIQDQHLLLTEYGYTAVAVVPRRAGAGWVTAPIDSEQEIPAPAITTIKDDLPHGRDPPACGDGPPTDAAILLTE